MRIRILCSLCILIFSAITLATDAPKWTGSYVNDYAGVISSADKFVLEGMLTELERNTTVEFAIVTLSQIPQDETKETYAYKIFNTWGIGKEGEDNGLLLLIIANSTPGNRMRFEIGYGLEGYITDAAAGRMLDDALPHYNAGNYSQAAYVIVGDVKNALEGKYISGYKGPTASGWINILPFLLPQLLFLGFFLASIAFAIRGVKPRCPRCGSTKLTQDGDYYICEKGHRFKKKKAKTWHGALVGAGAGGFGGGGFGGGGFGGGAGGGGGAGR